MNDRHDHEPNHTSTAQRASGHDSLDTKVDVSPPSPRIAPADIGSASRSCLAILILGALIVLVLCLSISIRTLV